jgi:preprotein translocase subunit SecY
MEQPDNFPDRVVCPNCDSVLVLDDNEKKGINLTCPECKFVITKERIKQSAPAASENAKPDGIAGRAIAFVATSSPLRNKILIMLAAIVVYRIGLQIHIPGVNTELLSEWMKSVGHYPVHRLFSQGIFPYLIGSACILLLSAILPPLRRLRDGNPMQQRRFDFFIYVAALVWSIQQAWGSYEQLKRVSFAGQSIVSGGMESQVTYIAMAAAGTMLLIWVADKIIETGLANGVAVIILTDIVNSFYHATRSIMLAVDAQNITSGTAMLILLIPVALILLSAIVLLSKRNIPLARINDEGDKASAQREPPMMPIRVMASGVLPFTIALWIMWAPGSYFSLQFNSFSYWIPYLVLVLIVSFMYIAITYDPKDIVTRLKRYGYRLAEAQSDEEAIAYLDTTVFRTILPGMVMIALFAALPYVINLAFGITGNFFTKEVMVLSAIAILIVQNVRSMRDSESKSDAGDDQNASNWVLLYTAETDLEGELLRDILAGEGISSKVTSNRVICATGTFAAWEICRPRFPAIMIHRRLGKGSVDVFVPAERESQAGEILKNRNLLS